MEWTNLEESFSFKLLFLWVDWDIRGMIVMQMMQWFDWFWIYMDLLIHVYACIDKMNKNKIKERKKKLLVSFGFSECLLKLWRRGCMEIPAAFRRGFFTEEIFRVFGYSRIFLSLTQALDVEIFLTLVLLCLSNLLESKSWVYIRSRM